MTPDEYAALCAAASARPVASLPAGLGDALAAELPTRGRITTPLRLAHFAAQVTHETEGFRFLVERGGPTYFAKYDGRRDLGNTHPGDGFSYRGRGLIQITGRANYAVYGKLLSLDLLGDPDEAAECGTAAAIAAAFWVAHGLNWLADADDLLTITRRINGGLNGLDDRAAALARAKAHLGIAVRR